jgi:MFS transporter, DHA2 family, multidrug resistance protein
MNAIAAIVQRTRPALSTTPALAPPQPAEALATSGKVLALGVMCLGFFIAYLDIQIVAASIQEIGER